MENVQTPEPVTKIPPTVELSRRRRRWPWIGIFAALLISICILWQIDRWIRPVVASGSGVNITTGSSGDSSNRNSVTDIFNEPPAEDEHPLAQPIQVAQAGLEFYRDNVQDYQAVFVKQERVGGRLSNEERSSVKFRRGRSDGDKAIPQAIYMRFLEPKSASGREVIYVEGQNDGRLVAHEGGLLNVIRAYLEPTSRLAMRGNKHPITEFGIEKLMLRLVEKGTRDLQFDDCEVEVNRNIEINGHRGTEIRIVHSKPSKDFDFHIARIIIDDELNLPVGYEGYLWPNKGSTEPVLNERYFYTDVKLNVGFTDQDFNPDNPEYDYP